MPLSLNKRRTYANFANGPISVSNKFVKGNLKNTCQVLAEITQLKRKQGGYFKLKHCFNGKGVLFNIQNFIMKLYF